MTSTELARRPEQGGAITHLEAIRGIDPQILIERNQKLREIVLALLRPTDLNPTGKDRDGNKKYAINSKGCFRIASALQLNVTPVGPPTITRDPDGRAIAASALAQCVGPDGRVDEQDGHCDIHESRFNGSNAAKTRERAMHDLASSALTRAKKRAILGYLGIGDVTLEDISRDGSAAPSAAAVVPPAAGRKMTDAAARAARYLCNGDPVTAEGILATLRERYGRLPEPAARALAITAKAVRDQRDAAAADAAPGDSKEPDTAADPIPPAPTEAGTEIVGGGEPVDSEVMSF